MTSSIISKRKKRRNLVLFQLLIVIGLLAVVWFSFGQNVLAPREQLDVPERLGTLELIGTIEGSAAMAQVSRLHGTDIKMASAYIVEYGYGNERSTVWVGTAENRDAAAELTRRMSEAIAKGGSGFTNLQQLTIDGHQVFQVDGPGGEHFFYTSRKTDTQVIWLIVETADALPILEQVLKTF